MFALHFAGVAEEMSKKMAEDNGLDNDIKTELKGDGEEDVEQEDSESDPAAQNGDASDEVVVEDGAVDAPAPQDKQNVEEPDKDVGKEEESTNSESSALAARQALLEARAINEATASADSSYVPSPSLLADTSPLPLLQQVDGPHLKNYTGAPNLYQAKDIPLAVRSKLEVPIYITSGGSVVEFSVNSAGYDVCFGVVAEREDKETVVKPMERVDAHIKPCNGKFLVGTVPCVLIFTFDNEYSWFTEKRITYNITVSPPSKENVLMGRRRRAKSALNSVEEDQASASSRLDMAVKQKETLAASVALLEKQLAEDKGNLDSVTKEEEFLKKRVELRTTQCDMLNDRLANGWEDEEE